jgi:BirA family biotin operon repressor/biotin-[acetyl-CoA-carboxylase] ligase
MASPAVAPAFRFRGVPAERHASLPSTNDEAFRRAAEGAPEGLVVTAAHQSAGRGRLGRSWWDRPGESAMASVLLRPAVPVARYPLLGIAMACAVADAAETLVPGVRFDVKWPNDVLHEGRKLCGVLAETRGAGGAAPPLVVGFGINVNQDAEAWPSEIRGRATSLRVAAGGRAFAIEDVLRAALERYDPHVSLAASGDAAGLRADVGRRLPPPGTTLTVVAAGGSVTGVVDGYEPNGALRLRDGAGTVHTLNAGESPPAEESLR